MFDLILYFSNSNPPRSKHSQTLNVILNPNYDTFTLQ